MLIDYVKLIKACSPEYRLFTLAARFLCSCGCRPAGPGGRRAKAAGLGTRAVEQPGGAVTVSIGGAMLPTTDHQGTVAPACRQ